MSAGTTTANNLTVHGVATLGTEVHIADGGTVFVGDTALFTASSTDGLLLSTGVTTSASDLAVVNKSYVDLVATGVRTLKDAVRVATSTNVAGTFSAGTLTVTGNSTLTIDGVTVAVGNRVLLRAQTAGAQNGIYTVTAAGSSSAPCVLARAGDANSSAEVMSGMFVWVTSGTEMRGSGWVLTTSDVVLNTTALAFVQVSGIPPVAAGNGVAITASGSIAVKPLTDSSLSAGTVVVTSSGVSVAESLPQLTSAGSSGAAIAVPGSGTDAYSSVVATDSSKALTLGAVPSVTAGVTSGRAIEFGNRSNGTWRMLPVRTGSEPPALLLQVSDGTNWSTVQSFAAL